MMDLEFSVLFKDGQCVRFSASAEIATDVVEHMTKMKGVLQITKFEKLGVALYPR